MQFPSGEAEGEYEFNNCVRVGVSPLVRTMSIPIPTRVRERPAWCSVSLCIYISKAKGLRIYDVWDKVIKHVHSKIGYVRSGARTENRTTITITSKIDVFKDMELCELQVELEEQTQCRVHIDHVITIN
tara:strand:+ start:440 stop:826 length:387 start_codon:yes stop_codon:yes gene_type:complete